MAAKANRAWLRILAEAARRDSAELGQGHVEAMDQLFKVAFGQGLEDAINWVGVSRSSLGVLSGSLAFKLGYRGGFVPLQLMKPLLQNMT